MTLILPTSSGGSSKPSPEPSNADRVAEAMSPAAEPTPPAARITAGGIIEGCTLLPLGAQIAVLRDPPDEKSKGGIVLPNQDRQRARAVQRGTVVRVGTGFLDHTGKTHAPPVAAGDRVVFAQYAGADIEHPEAWGNQVYTLMQQGEILAKIGTV